MYKKVDRYTAGTKHKCKEQSAVTECVRFHC